MKKCSVCKKDKPYSGFYKQDDCKDGHRSACKICMGVRQRDFIRNNPQKRHGYLLNRYGISQRDYETMLAAQGGVCAICKNPERAKKGYFSVDHSHLTNEVRGLLCLNCNTLLGKAKDNPAILESAVNYLKNHDIKSKRIFKA